LKRDKKQTGRLRLEAVKQEAPTAVIKNLKAAGLKEGTTEFNEALLQTLVKPGEVIESLPDGGFRITKGGQKFTEEQVKLASKRKFSQKLAESRAAGIGKREATDISSGSLAADLMPIFNRNLELLQDIETGGFSAVVLKLKQITGTETANEAELLNAFGKQVITQIKPMFGGQPSEAEGQWLKDMEAGFGKSTVANIRLMERGIKLATERARKGIRAAEEAGDVRTVEEIRRALSFIITPAKDIELRGLQLRRQGFTNEQISDKLIEEGFLNQVQ